MSKKIKELELNSLRKTFQGVRDFVLLEPLKLDSAADYTLRKSLREKKVRVKMVKNSFVRKVFSENGMTVETGSGPTLLCWGADSAKSLGTAVEAALKLIRPDLKVPEKVKEKVGIADGETMTLAQLAKVPTKQEAIGEVLAAVLAPGAALAGALTAPGADLAGILKAVQGVRAQRTPAAVAVGATDSAWASEPAPSVPGPFVRPAAGAGARLPLPSVPRPPNNGVEPGAAPVRSSVRNAEPDPEVALRALERWLPLLHGIGAGRAPERVRTIWGEHVRNELFRSPPAVAWLDQCLAARPSFAPQRAAALEALRRVRAEVRDELTGLGEQLAPQAEGTSPPNGGSEMDQFILVLEIGARDGGPLTVGHEATLRAVVAKADVANTEDHYNGHYNWVPAGPGEVVAVRVFATGSRVLPAERYLSTPPQPGQSVEFTFRPRAAGRQYLHLALVDRHDSDVYTASQYFTVEPAAAVG
ncbi:50S ribosomal protein L10 [Gemmata obscuriglobus]|uniref:Large ribosomal subunit protein uL10 n=1 Tax=Gemmata obscuriglobus TaxID=114 RepID=A0A2Z3HBI8_9BACT|nr:50S ribosomal protein L10 [Gemmata obscuriglobus]AWM40335.1 50S ribosomal protein L10 [Gemmata obscuriglobus]QEG26451.1 50S ribosomal protein L10 [Gemmata obscuriglobus]VTS01641.1 50s ribosomal protein l10 : Probable 50S ribosomal protein L10 OS=Planctomyces maris DSM 8797 GN=PM8797T_12141 PE=3 SV=1: Ribosomal_L10 [Gemmata obscuriglobus UQM 2246]